MKIFNNGINLKSVLFACNRCNTVWSATPDFYDDYTLAEQDHETRRKWRETHPIENKYYRRSDAETFVCECPNCGKTTKTPVNLHNAYVTYGKDLD